MNQLTQKRISLDDAIFTMIILEIMVIRWFSFLNYGALAIELLIVIRLYSGNSKKVGTTFLYVILLLGYMIFSFFLFGGSINLLIYNIRDIIALPLLILYFEFLIRKRPDFLRKKKEQLVNIFNIYYIANVIAVFMEMLGYTWVAGFDRSEDAVNFTPGSWDSVSGLLGVNGHHLLAVYTALMVVLNLSRLKSVVFKTNRIFFASYIFFIVIFMSWVSVNADNKGFYITLLLFLVCYYFICKNVTAKKKKALLSSIKSNLGTVCVCVIVTICIFNVLNRIPVFNEQFYYIESEIVRAIANSEHTQGSGERIAMIVYAFTNSNNLFFGNGIANALWKEPNYLGFLHFGQSDLSTFLILGGLIFVFLVFVCLNRMYNVAFKNKSLNLMMHTVFLYLLSYMSIVTDMSGLLLFFLFFLVMYVQYNKYIERA